MFSNLVHYKRDVKKYAYKKFGTTLLEETLLNKPSLG